MKTQNNIALAFVATVFLTPCLLAEPIKVADSAGKFTATVEIICVARDSVQIQREDDTTRLVPISVFNLDSLSRITIELQRQVEKKPYLEDDIEILQSTLAITKNPRDLEALTTRATAYFMAREFDLSAQDYTTIDAINPLANASLVMRGRAYYKLGKLNLAIIDLSQAIRIDSRDVSAHSYLGLAYAKNGDFDNECLQSRPALKIKFW